MKTPKKMRLLIHLPHELVSDTDIFRASLLRSGLNQSRSFVIESALRIFLNQDHRRLVRLFRTKEGK